MTKKEILIQLLKIRKQAFDDKEDNAHENIAELIDAIHDDDPKLFYDTKLDMMNPAVKFENVTADKEKEINDDLAILSKYNGLSNYENLKSALDALQQWIDDDSSINLQNVDIIKGYLDTSARDAKSAIIRAERNAWAKN